MNISLLLMTALAAHQIAARPRQTAVGGDPWQLVHPRARWILGIDWARARNSAAAQILSRQFAGARSKMESSGLGLGAMVSLERIVASGVSLDAGSSRSPKGLVLALEGRLDRTRLRKELPPGTAIEKFRGADLFVPPKAREDEPLIAAVHDRLLLIGDRESLGLILAGKGGPQDADLFGRAARLAGAADLWMAALSPEKPAGGSGETEPLRDLRSMELAISLRDGLRFHVSAEAATAEAAQHLSGLLQLASGLGEGSAPLSWLRRMNAEFKGSSLILSLTIPASELERTILEGKETMQRAARLAVESWFAGERGDPGTASEAAIRAKAPRQEDLASPASPAPAPKVRTIRITGADSGPAEIHYVPPR